MKKKNNKKLIWMICLPVAAILLAVVFTLVMKAASISRLEIPQIVSAQGIDEHQIVLKWEKNEDASGYEIYRKLDSEEAEWELLATIEDNTVDTYTDSEVQPGTVYYYSIKAFEKTNEKYKYTRFDSVGKAVLSGLETPMLYSVEVLEDRQVEMKWVPADNASGYGIYRQTEDGEEEELAIISSGETDSYIDQSEKENINYIYTMRAFVEKPDMNTAWSAYADGISVLAGVDAPEMKSAKRLGENWIKVEWEPVDEADGYCVYSKEKDEWVEKANVTDCTWMDEDAAAKKSSYCVKAFKTNGSRTVYSDFSESKEAGALEKSEEMQALVDYWVGDSRTVYLGENLGIYYRCYGMSGAKYDWYSGVADAWIRMMLDNKPDATIVLNFGVNDVEDTENASDQYIEKYKQLIKDYPKAKIWFMSVNPTDDKYTWAEIWGITAQDMKDHVIRFNEKLQKEFPDQYIDTYSYLTQTGFETMDGLHYTVETEEKIYWYALSWINE